MATALTAKPLRYAIACATCCGRPEESLAQTDTIFSKIESSLGPVRRVTHAVAAGESGRCEAARPSPSPSRPPYAKTRTAAAAAGYKAAWRPASTNGGGGAAGAAGAGDRLPASRSRSRLADASMELLSAAACALLAATLALCVHWALDPTRRRLARGLQAVPGPLALPVLGNAYLVINKKRSDFFALMDGVTRKYWPIFKAWNGRRAVVNLSDAKHIELILNNSVNINKAYSYDFLQPWLGTGLLTSKGSKWHSRRKLLTPAFHFKILDTFMEVFAEKSKILVERLEDEVGKPDGFDIYPYLTLCALDIICETAMGTEVNCQRSSQSPYVTAIYEISELVIQRLTQPWLHPNFIYYLTKNGKRFKMDVETLHGFSNKVIKERKKSRMRNVDEKGEIKEGAVDEVYGTRRRLAFLDLLLEASENGTVLTDEEIREEVDTFMFEGHDTTSASLCWTLYLLGRHPRVQEKVYEELQQIFAGSDRMPTTRDVAEMKYLERVIKESLRLYPSVPFISRSITSDVQLDKYFIPAGCQVTTHIYHVHRNPDYFPNPDTFDPDNFLPERVQGRHPYAYVPFSAGPRNCIGQKFALLEEKVILSSVIRKYKVKSLERPEDITLICELILRPEKGIKMVLERR